MKPLHHRILRKLGRITDDLRSVGAYRQLESHAPQERGRFAGLANEFANQHQAIAEQDSAMVPLWSAFTARLQKSLLPRPTWEFLRDPVISATMVMDKRGPNMAAELAFLRSCWTPAALKEILRENPVGHPRLADASLLTSHNTIHHAHHIGRFLHRTSVSPTNIRSVVEWGGGYGNLAKLWRRIAPTAPTWITIDLPILATLQWLYLSAVLGPQSVRLLHEPGQQILEGGVTIIPTHLVEAYPLQADLFVSTWAISESPPATQEMVIGRRWFNAKHLLLGYQDSNTDLPTAARIGEAARGAGAVIEDLPHLAGSYYAFK